MVWNKINVGIPDQEQNALVQFEGIHSIPSTETYWHWKSVSRFRQTRCIHRHDKQFVQLQNQCIQGPNKHNIFCESFLILYDAGVVS